MRAKHCFLLLFVKLNLKLVLGGEPSLHFNREPVFSTDHELVTVSVEWSDVRYNSVEDYIGVYACEDNICSTPEVFEKTPIQYKLVKNMYEKHNLASYWRTATDKEDFIPSNGRTRFSILIRSDVSAYQLAYITGPRQFFEVAAISEPFVIPLNILYKPREIRLSLAGENAMRVIWTESSSNKEQENSVLLFGSVPDRLDRQYKAISKYHFNDKDLCGRHLYPAATVGYTSLGIQTEVILSNLLEGDNFYTIQYQVLGKVYQLPVRSFSLSNSSETNIIAFGDMGQSMNLLDGSLQHSFDNDNHGEIAASFTAKLLESLVFSGSERQIDLINHFGDISYATGQLALWNNFLLQNAKVMGRVPWMVGIGNHEMGWSQSFVVGSDSQGECGVPYMALFPYSYTDAKGSLKQEPLECNGDCLKQALISPYYSFVRKSVYNIMISTETNFTRNSKQFIWIEKELEKANALRNSDVSSIEWILVMGHRPMYISDPVPEITSERLLTHLEGLFLNNSVDIALWGHHHSYQRFKCKIAQGKCSENGIVQILTGHAGFAHTRISRSDKYKDIYRVQNNEDWGVNILSFKNATHCHVRYIENARGTVLDEFWISKQTKWLD